jgi:hypothetical protein
VLAIARYADGTERYFSGPEDCVLDGQVADVIRVLFESGPSVEYATQAVLAGEQISFTETTPLRYRSKTQTARPVAIRIAREGATPVTYHFWRTIEPDLHFALAVSE